MKRESRYYIFKISDVNSALTKDQIAALNIIENILRSHRIGRGAGDLRAVVVESDWPEYEPTWKSIEARVDGKSENLPTCKTCGGDGEVAYPVELGAAVYECPDCGPSSTLRPGVVLKSISAAPKDSEVLILSRWGEKYYVADSTGRLTTLTSDDIFTHWRVEPNARNQGHPTQGENHE